MTARRSAQTEQAIRLYEQGGKSMYEAASMAGIWPSTLYRALETKRKQENKKKIDKRDAKSE